MNHELIRKKLEQLNSSSAPREDRQQSSIMWKPEVGTNQIRILPNPYNPEWPFTELYVYYNKFGKTFVSPKSFGKLDPIDEFARKLRSSRDETSRKAASNIEPTLRTFVMVLVRGKEDEGPKFWSFGKMVYASLLGFMNDPDYGDITNLTNGRDVVVEYALGKGKDLNEQKRNSDTTIRVKPSETKAFTDPSIVEKIKAMKNPEELFNCPSEDELKKMLEDYLNGDSRQQVSPGNSPTSAENNTTTSSNRKEPDNFNLDNVTPPVVEQPTEKKKFDVKDIDDMFAEFEK